MNGLGYSRQLSEELCHRPLESSDRILAELSGMGIGQQRSEWTIASSLAARRAYRLAKALGLEASVRLLRRGRRLSYVLEIKGPLMLEGASSKNPGAFLRGCFLTHGYMNSPERGPHLEFRLREADVPEVVSALRKIRVKARTMPHHGGITVYVKAQEDILRLLAEIGGHQALLRMESLRVVRAVKNQINRLVNSETANLARTVESGVEQARVLARLASTSRWGTLPEPLLVVAKARLVHPDWSLKEIGQSLTPPLTKSAVNHRMRRLLAIAKES